jgi:hypothetical protein
MTMMQRIRIAGLAAALCLIAAAPARADFFPVLGVDLAPPTASTAPGLTATITQPAKDSAIERFTLNLAAGFESIGAPGAQPCSTAALQAAACPPASRIGTVDGLIGDTLGFSGAIHKVSADRFAVVVSTLGGSIGQVVPGSLTKRSDASLDLKLDQLPSLPLTSLTLRFDSGARSLIRTPSKCGSYDVDGKFTSRSGELALDRTVVAVTGCSGVPAVRVANLRLSHRSFRAGGSRLGYRTIIAWWAARGADHTNVRIERQTRRGWHVLGVLVTDAQVGQNIVRWDGRLRDRALKRGSYGVRIQPAGSAPSKLVRFRVL